MLSDILAKPEPPSGPLHALDRHIQHALTVLQEEIRHACTVDQALRLQVRLAAISDRAAATEQLALAQADKLCNGNGRAS
jgi:hypothetical protein